MYILDRLRMRTVLSFIAHMFVLGAILAAYSYTIADATPDDMNLVGTQCSGPEPPLITDFNVYKTPSLLEPPARTYFRDPVFGRCLVRVTDRMTDILPPDSSGGLKNEYSRIQAFNADETKILVRSTSAYWYLYDAKTLARLSQLPIQGAVDPRWDAKNPNLLYYISEGTTQLMSFNVLSGTKSLVHDFAADFPGHPLYEVWTRYEGSPSMDGRYWGFMAEDPDYSISAFLIYDQVQNKVTAMRNLGANHPSIDSVTISPLGDYFVAQFDYCDRSSPLGTDSNPCGLMVYDHNLQNGRGLVRIIGHSDLALDAQGHEVMIYQENDIDYIAMVDLASGTVTPLFHIDFSNDNVLGLHFSGRALNLPGWALVSTDGGKEYTWMDNQIFAVELKEGGRVVRLAHTHSVVDAAQEKDYWAESQATTNRNFTRVLFTSNWGRSGTDEVDMYMIQLSMAGISLIKKTNGQDANTKPGPYIPVGGIVTWTYQVTNTGIVNLTNVQVTDNITGLIGTIPLLLPGQIQTLTKTGTAAAGQYSNLGGAQGTSPTGATVSAQDPSHYFGQVPSWNTLGGYVTSSPSVVVDNAGKTEAWVRGGDNALWVNIDGTWRGKEGILSSAPFAVKDYNGKIHVLVRGGDNSVWDFIYDPIAATGHWKGLGGYITEAPTAAQDPMNLGVMRIAVKGGDNALYTCDLNINTEAYAWTGQGGLLTSRPYILFDPSGKEHILVRGGDSALWDKKGVWGGSSYTRIWNSFGGYLASGPIATIEPGNTNNVAAFVKGGDNALWMCDVTSGSNSETGTWYGFGGIISSDQFAVADASANKIHVFVRGGDSALWENIFTTSPWSPGGNQWQGIGGSILTYTPGAAIGSNTQAFVIGTDNALWQNTHTTFSAASSTANSTQKNDASNQVNYP